MSVRRSSKPVPGQGELALAIPIPAHGTVVIMRIEDYLARRGTAGDEPPPRRAVARPRKDPIEDSVIAWLSGEGTPDSYSADTPRTAAGRVITTTCAAVVDGCGLGHISTDDGTRRSKVGRVLQRHGWIRRYVTADVGPRERRYYAPPEWLYA